MPASVTSTSTSEAAQIRAKARRPTLELSATTIAVTGPGSVVWLFGPAPDRLAVEIAATGGLVWQSEEDPMAELIRVHRLAAPAKP